MRNHRRSSQLSHRPRYAAEQLESRLLLAAQMVADLSPGSPGSDPSAMVNVNGTLFFIADDGVHGRELWKSDGTSEGTVLVKDIQPGAAGALKGSWITSFAGEAFFAADDGVNGNELWKSDGTPDGTVMVKDITANGSSFPGKRNGDDDQGYAVVGNALFFRATDIKGTELWKTDGTATGTVLVKDINPSGNSSPGELTSFNNQLIFNATSNGSDFWLFRSDGTAAGTIALYPAGVKISHPIHLTPSGGYLYFVNGATRSVGLWRTDGTVAGTSLFSSTDGAISGLTDVNGKLFFNSYNAGITDLYVLNPGVGISPVNAGLPTSPQRPEFLTNIGGVAYFRANVGSGVPALWRSDGTAAGTQVISNVQPDTSNGWLRHFVPYGAGFVFFGDDGVHGRALWKSDGTSAGTAMIRALSLPAPDYVNPPNLAVIGQTIFFDAIVPDSGVELFRSDGTGEQTLLVKDVYTAGYGSNPVFGAELNGLLYFAGDNGNALWRSDGTLAGTARADDLFPNGFVSQPRNFLTINGVLYFSAFSPTLNGTYLWRTDGTRAGTFTLKTALGAADPGMLTNMDGTLFFTAFDTNISVTRLWETDGSLDHTHSFGTGYNTPTSVTALGNRVFFAATSAGSVDVELWVSDGTDSGTVKVKDLNLNGASSNPRSLATLNNSLYFLADGLEGDTALWKTDGTPQGTVQVISLTGTLASDLLAANGKLFFLRSDPDTGRELWESDGTAAGTHILRDIVPGPGSSKIKNLRVFGSTLYFQANDIDHGAELWKTDGTADGTQMVADIAPGLDDSNAIPAFDANGLIILTAQDPQHGSELWGTDGTAAGTHLLADINPGPTGSNPSGFTIANGVLYFAANDGPHGNELWKLPDIPQRLQAEADGPYTVPEGQSVTLSSYGSTGDISAYEWDFDYDPAAGFQVDATGPSPTFAGLDGPSTHTVALRIRTAAGQTSIDTAQVIVTNVAPIASALGPQSIAAGVPYVLQLKYSDPGQDSPHSWQIEWGDGAVETVGASATSASHIYTHPGWQTLYVHVTDDDGTFAITVPGVTVGGLDATFNSTGYLALPTFGNSNPLVSDIQTLSDGRILVLGYDWTIWRFMPDGSPDRAFGGGDGLIRPGIDEPDRTRMSANALALYPDATFVVAGVRDNISGGLGTGVVSRFNADGTYDVAFGTVSAGGSNAKDVSLQDDGKILVAGVELGKMQVDRLYQNGTFDLDFENNSHGFADFQASGSTALAVMQEPGGDIFVGGASGSSATQQWAMARLKSSGIPDPTFGTDGNGRIQLPLFSGAIEPIAYTLQKDGKLVSVGWLPGESSPSMVIIRCNPDGTLDPSFNGTGYIARRIGKINSANSVLVDTSGRIVVGARVDNQLALLRFLPDGRPDPDFADDGVMISSDLNIGGYVTRLALAPDGRIIVAGSAGDTGAVDYLMQFIQSPLSVQVTAPPIASPEILVPGYATGKSITPASQSLLKPEKNRTLFSDQRIAPKPPPTPVPGLSPRFRVAIDTTASCYRVWDEFGMVRAFVPTRDLFYIPIPVTVSYLDHPTIGCSGAAACYPK